MKIQKFGTATLASADKIKAVAAILKEGGGDIAVLSSMQGTAEALTEISNYLYKKNQEGANEIINRLELEYLNLSSVLFVKDEFRQKASGLITAKFDYIRSFTKDLFTLFEERIVLAQGEILSTELVNLYLTENGLKTVYLYAPDFVRTDKNAVPDASYIKEKLTHLLSENKDADVYITQGYICRNAYGEIDDLRKGGSDLSACLIGAAVGAKEIRIWADMDVMQNNDSRYVKGTKVIRQLNFHEAAELTYFGAKILHPSSILPAKMANIPVRLMNTNCPDTEGTLISNETEPNTIKAVAAKDGITAIKIKSGRMLLAHGFLRRVFEVFENYQTSIDMLASSEVGISMTIDNTKNLDNIVDDLKKYGTVSVDKGMVIIGIVGDLNWENTGFQSLIMEAVEDVPVRMISYGGSNYNVSLLIKHEDKERALQLLNEKLFNK
ncbi:aspartate kinase [Dysgonomonas sp. 25]|uniref:aspartate kinase n=1 Tax=Dysgonomonas sp. 25 TaxID=2302933 RepID=UPI0013D2E91B|nr:aspartate kinase [Dysgonomonas sp. 25]NDV68377.1 aspartate kinase [Dysgonomonas sp. 25]